MSDLSQLKTYTFGTILGPRNHYTLFLIRFIEVSLFTTVGLVAMQRWSKKAFRKVIYLSVLRPAQRRKPN